MTSALRFLSILALATTLACSSAPKYRTFASPEDAVKALTTAVKAGNLGDVIAIFGPEGQELIDSSDAVAARRNREVFVAAVAERWRLEEQGPATRVLVIGNEDWPFPVPIVKDASGWRFDTAAGKEEVLARRIGRNELAAIRVCHTYVTAQHIYAQRAHDGQAPGQFARQLKSDEGRENGLYWPVLAGKKRSPLGDLVAYAAEEGRTPDRHGAAASPFHGYFFRLLSPDAAGFPGLVAWPAQYDATGVMTFVIGADGVVREKDLGADTDKAARSMSLFNPDSSWSTVQ